MEDGKFHPHKQYKKGVRKSRDQKAKLQGVRLKKEPKFETKTYKVWTFENAPKDVQEKILEKNRYINVEYDDFWADYDGIIYDKKTNIGDYDVFNNYSKKYYDLDRGQYIQFTDLEVKDHWKLAQMLGIPKSLANRIGFIFNNERERNTELEIKDLGTYENVTEEDSYEDYKKYSEVQSFDIKKKLTKSEFDTIQKAIKKWSELMDDAWRNLKNSYEYAMSDESLKDFFMANDYKFTEDGKID